MSKASKFLFSKEHEWVQVVEGNLVRIGISDYAQDQLGDIVFVELPEVGDEISANESMGSIESVKTVSELYAPITGKIVKVNEELEDSPELVNESPYEQGWMVEAELADPSELDALLSEEAYLQYIKEEEE